MLTKTEHIARSRKRALRQWYYHNARMVLNTACGTSNLWFNVSHHTWRLFKKEDLATTNGWSFLFPLYFPVPCHHAAGRRLVSAWTILEYGRRKTPNRFKFPRMPTDILKYKNHSVAKLRSFSPDTVCNIHLAWWLNRRFSWFICRLQDHHEKCLRDKNFSRAQALFSLP